MMKEKKIVDFAESREAERWEIVNDGVMGGISKSRFVVTAAGTAIFEGEVSLENLGGFASIRSHAGDFDLRDSVGLSMRVRGDGKRYRVRLRTDDDGDGFAYQTTFQTKAGEWIVEKIPFGDFVPVFRGRILVDVERLDPRNVRRIGFMIADRQEGPFRLEIAWVKAYG